MALHLNLYHEIHKQAQERARDPFKLAGLGALLIAILLVCFYFYRASVVNGVETRLSGLQTKWKRLEPEMKRAKEREAELIVRAKTNQILVDRLHGRFYWAFFLEHFSAAVPPTVQILSFTGDFSNPERPVNVVFTAIAAGEQPRTVAEEFRTGLQKKLSSHFAEATAEFDANSLEEMPDQIEFQGESLGTAKFRIRLLFKPVSPAAAEAAPTPAPTPTPKAAKRKKK